MNLTAVLLRNELLKARKRPALWVGLGLLALMASLGFGQSFLEARGAGGESFALPGAWAEILGGPVQIPMMFGCIVLILLVASEFSWRTARQNVIDGLSKSEWYRGKTLLVGLVLAAFLGVYLAVGGGLALAGTEAGGAPLVRAHHAAAVGGVALSFAGLAGLALLCATAIRSTGAAIAVWFFYFAVGEQLISGLAGRYAEGLRPALRFLPVNVFNSLAGYRQWDPDAYARAAERAVEAGRPAPELWATGELVGAGAGWAALFVVVGWIFFRRRDL